MERKLSIISFNDMPDAELYPSRFFSIGNSRSIQTSLISIDDSFIVEGMLFGLCLKGHAKLKINYREYILNPNAIFTILPNQVFESLERSDDHYVEYLLFSVDFVNNLPFPKDYSVFNKINLSPCLYLSDEKLEELVEYYSFVVKACNRDKHLHKENIAKSLWTIIITLIASFYKDAKPYFDVKSNIRRITVVEEFLDLLMEYCKVVRKASFYADKMCMTTKSLSRILRDLTGKSLTSWITEAVLLEAKFLLKYSSLSILQISEELNFATPSFFNRYFKQYEGSTPLRYRES